MRGHQSQRLAQERHDPTASRRVAPAQPGMQDEGRLGQNGQERVVALAAGAPGLYPLAAPSCRPSRLKIVESRSRVKPPSGSSHLCPLFRLIPNSLHNSLTVK